MMRRILFCIALAAIWFGVLGWAAGLRWNTPLLPRARHALSGYDFQARLGGARRSAQELVVDALGNDGTGLQSAMRQRISAAESPIMRYRIANFPNTLELALVFRRNDTPDDVQTISLPAPGSGEAVVDLSAFAEWRGDITEIGFAEYAAAQLVPPSVGAAFAPFAIGRVELQARAWSQLPARLRTDWFAYRPWTLRSINTLGAPTETLAASSMQAALGLGASLSLLALALIPGCSRRRIAHASIAVAGAAWLALDLRWLDDLAAKHALTEAVYADKSWEQRAALQPDESTLAQAREVVQQLALAQQATRVLVASDSAYTQSRLAYFLLPLNAAQFGEAVAGSSGAQLPPDVLIALVDSDWRYNAASAMLSTPHGSFAVRPLYEKGALRVFRARGAAP